MVRLLRRLLVLALVGAGLVYVAKRFRGDAAPAFTDANDTIDLRPTAAPVPVAAVPSTPATDEALATPPSGAGAGAGAGATGDAGGQGGDGAAAAAEGPTQAGDVDALLDDAAAEELAAREPIDDDGGAWTVPVDGLCPTDFLVKAKMKSGVYREPGMAGYETTKPDRCYRTVEAAEADGLRPAKR